MQVAVCASASFSQLYAMIQACCLLQASSLADSASSIYSEHVDASNDAFQFRCAGSTLVLAEQQLHLLCT